MSYLPSIRLGIYWQYKSILSSRNHSKKVINVFHFQNLNADFNNDSMKYYSNNL